MSLTSRVTAFFLTALAVAFVGFSLSLYLLERRQLEREQLARLNAALDTLLAAVEFKPGGLEWEPQERRLSLGHDPAPSEIRWFIGTATGEMVGQSPNLDAADLRNHLRALNETNTIAQVVDPEGQSWRVLQRRVENSAPRVAEAGGIDAKQANEPRLYDALVFSAAVSQLPAQATLTQLAWTLTGLSTALWLLAALVGRRLCRRALVPVTGMATAARGMKAADLDQRLPDPGTGDELADLSVAFNDLLARLQESFERQRRFTGDASHQLRTPLTAMLGQIEVILRRSRSAEEYRQVLALVQSQAQQLRQIVEMLLFLARADGEARLPNLETVDLVSWLDEYGQHWQEHPRSGDVEFVHGLPGPLLVNVQPPLLCHLLDNLLDNACKYTVPGTPVTVRLDRKGNRVELSVADKGPGIAADDLAHIFEPFYRSAEARRRGIGGVGLGLAVVQRSAAALGGEISVQSGPGKNAQFVLRLPEVNALWQGTENLPVAPKEMTERSAGVNSVDPRAVGQP